MREICLYVTGERETHLFCDTDECLPDDLYSEKMNKLALRNVPAFSVPCFSNAPPLNRLGEAVQNLTSQLVGTEATPGVARGDACTLGMVNINDPVGCKTPLVCVSDFQDKDSGTCQNCSPMNSERNECMFTLPRAAIEHCANLHGVDPKRVFEFGEYKNKGQAIHGDSEARRFYDDLGDAVAQLSGERRNIAECVVKKEQADSGCCENFVCNPHVSVSLLVDEDRAHLPGTCERPKFMSSCKI